MLHVAQFGFCFDQRLDRFDRSLDGPWQLVHILWLDDSLEVILQDLGEVVYPSLAMCAITATRPPTLQL